MFLRTFLLSYWFTLAGSVSILPAQNTPGLNRYDARIAYFESAGRLDSMLYYARKKAQLARQMNRLEHWAWIQVEIHDLPSDEPGAALRQLDDALARQWRAPADSAECEPFMYIQAYRGYYLSATGRIWQAVQAYEAAREWFERYRYADPDFEAAESVYKPLGNHYTRLGDNEKALAVFQKALALTPAENTPGLAGLYNNIGIAHWNSGNFSKAETSYQAGLRLAGLPSLQRALLLTGRARTQLDQGRFTPALQSAETALRVLQQVSREEESAREYRVYAQLTAGLAMSRTARYSRAGNYLKRALAESRKVFGAHSRETGKIEIALAGLFRAKGNPAEALAAANRALAAVIPAFHPTQATDNPNAALFYEENTIFEALEEKAAAACALYREKGDLKWLTVSLDCHDKAWQAESLLRRVYQYRSSKLELQKTTRAREEAAMDVVRELYERTGQAAYLEKAFTIAERSKAALLLDALHDNLIRRRLAGRDERFRQLAALRQNAAWYERQLLLQPGNRQSTVWRAENDALQAQIVALERTLQQAYPGLKNSAGEQYLSFKNLQIPDGEILAEYFVGQTGIDVFVLSGNVPTAWQRIPLDDSLRRLTNRYLAFFENAGAMLSDPAGYLQTAFALWQMIVPPETAAAPRLTIVPDGFLNFIPFEALVTAPGSASLRTAAYLIRRQEIRYAWSLAILQRQEALRSNAAKFFLGVAPLFERGERGLAPLTAGKAEWQTLPTGSLDALIGAAADTARFLASAGRYRLLHLGTHARADRRNEQPPSVELYDAPLLLPDIYALPLEADLVVLSACQTGLGAEQKGEGVMSLARAFAQSGAACILSGLWTVNDRSTTRLFRDFYRSLNQGTPVAGALRAAKLQYINDKNIPAAAQSPYFWAGMVAVGANRKTPPPLEIPWPLLLGAGATTLFILAAWSILRKKRRGM